MPIERLCCLLLGAAIVVRLFVTGLDEVQQAFRPGGHADALDFVADACGAFFAASLMGIKWRKDPVCAESLEP